MVDSMRSRSGRRDIALVANDIIEVQTFGSKEFFEEFDRRRGQH